MSPVSTDTLTSKLPLSPSHLQIGSMDRGNDYRTLALLNLIKKKIQALNKRVQPCVDCSLLFCANTTAFEPQWKLWPYMTWSSGRSDEVVLSCAWRNTDAILLVLKRHNMWEATEREIDEQKNTWYTQISSEERWKTNKTVRKQARKKARNQERKQESKQARKKGPIKGGVRIMTVSLVLHWTGLGVGLLYVHKYKWWVTL